MLRSVLALGLSLGLGAGASAPVVLAKPQNAPERAAVRSGDEAQAKGRTRSRSPVRQGAAHTRARTPKEGSACLTPRVEITRQRGTEIERRTLSLMFCDGQVNPSALDSLSVLARPRDVERPYMPEIRAYRRRPLDRGPRRSRRDPDYLSSEVRLLHPGLVERLQKVAEHFPHRTFEIVSGHRPHARVTSRHHHARALDFRVQGVSRERLRDFLRTFPKTGVGYYPNSTFVHMDVRDDRGYWVDRSGPGEPADYGSWPPTRREIDRASARILEGAMSDLSALAATDVSGTRAPRERRVDVRPSAPQAQTRAAEPHRELDEQGDALSAAEIDRIRDEARRALETLR